VVGACQVVCVSGRGLCILDVWVDAVGVDEDELSEGLFPVGGDLVFDESSGCFALPNVESAFFGALACPLVLDVADRQPEQLGG
jgi:hypothetical protein